MHVRSFVRNAALTAIVGAALSAGPALAQSDAELLASNCFMCHGPRGVSTTEIPKLSDLSKEKIVDSMKKFRAGTLPATIMDRIVKGYTDEQIDVIATYLEKTKAK